MLLCGDPWCWTWATCPKTTPNELCTWWLLGVGSGRRLFLSLQEHCRCSQRLWGPTSPAKLVPRKESMLVFFFFKKRHAP